MANVSTHSLALFNDGEQLDIEHHVESPNITVAIGGSSVELAIEQIHELISFLAMRSGAIKVAARSEVTS